MIRITILSILFLLPLLGRSQYKMTQKEYIDTYKGMAMRSMKEYRIPASITMAQGILESGNGGSRLAVEGNNHFGIKCKGSWTGGRVYHDDDEKGECFRKYRNAEYSYRDHSKFLTGQPRYGKLFDLRITDYKGWAHGLKAAGYATNPRYAYLLISIIENNQLYKLDTGGSIGVSGAAIAGGLLALLNKHRKTDNASTAIKHTIDKNNGVRYIVSTDGESFASISDQYNMSIKRLLKINDLKATFPLPVNTALYIESKRSKSVSKYRHNVISGDSYHSISQRYGIKLKSLQRMNPTTRKFPPRIGQQLQLR